MSQIQIQSNTEFAAMGKKLLIFVVVTMIVIVKGNIQVRDRGTVTDNSHCQYCAVEAAYAEAIGKVKNGVRAIFNLLNRLEKDLTSGKEFECDEFSPLIQSTKVAASTVITNASDIQWNVITMLRPESLSIVQKYREIAAASASDGFKNMFLTMELIAGNNPCKVRDRMDAMESNVLSKFANFVSQYFIAMQEDLSGGYEIIANNEYYEEISVISIRLVHRAIFAQIRRILEKICSASSTLEDYTDPQDIERRAIAAVTAQINSNFDAFRAYGNVCKGDRDACGISNYDQ